MKKTLIAMALIGLSSTAFATEQEDIGGQIYNKFMGRGCGACHDSASNPQLVALIKDGKLDRASFEKTLKEGKGDGKMPKAIEAIMAVGAVKKAGYGEDQAVDALYAYLKSK